MVKNLPAMQETPGSIPGSGRCPRQGNTSVFSSGEFPRERSLQLQGVGHNWVIKHTDGIWNIKCNCKLTHFPSFTTREILVPWLGIEPTSPALEGGFLTTGPAGKSPRAFGFLSQVTEPSYLPKPPFRQWNTFIWKGWKVRQERWTSEYLSHAVSVLSTLHLLLHGETRSF